MWSWRRTAIRGLYALAIVLLAGLVWVLSWVAQR